MSKEFLLIRPRFTEYNGVFTPQAELDFAIPFLDEDIPLYVDPFLVWRSPSFQDKGLHQLILGAFNNLGALVKSGDREKAIGQLITASECDEVGLGTSATRKGARIGRAKAEEVISLFERIPYYRDNGFRHFEEIQLFVDGIGKDRVCDISCNFIKSFLIDYTAQECRSLGIDLQKTTIPAVYNLGTQDFEDVVTEVPVHPETGRPVLLVPKRWLRHVPWINYDTYFRSFCPQDDIAHEGEELTRVKVLTFNRDNYGVVDSYVTARERSFEDCAVDPLFSQIPVLSARRKFAAIKKLPTGKDGYRQARGEEHYCPKRAENWDMRLSRHDDQDKLKYWRADSDEPRSMAEDIKQAKAANDPKAEKLVAEFKKKLGKLSSDGKAMKERHSAEWKSLGAHFKDRKAQVYSQAENGIKDAIANVKNAYRPKWQEIGRRHSRERRVFRDREKRVSGKIRNAIDAVTHARRLDPDSSRGFVANAFNYLTSSKKRAQALDGMHRAQVRELSTAQRAEIGAAINSVKGERTTLLSSARGSFLAERAALIQRQATDKQQLKVAWRRHGEERKRAFEASRGFAKSKQQAKADKTVGRDNERGQFRSASDGRKPRSTGRKRSRKRTRRQE